MKRGWKYVGVWMENGRMNMTRTMGCKIWIACQDQIYGRIMEVCRIMYGHGKCIWMDESKVDIKIKEGQG